MACHTGYACAREMERFEITCQVFPSQERQSFCVLAADLGISLHPFDYPSLNMFILSVFL